MPPFRDALKRLRNGPLCMSFSSSEQELLDELSHPLAASLVGRSVDDEDPSVSKGFFDLGPDPEDITVAPLIRLEEECDNTVNFFLFLASFLALSAASSCPLCNCARSSEIGLFGCFGLLEICGGNTWKVRGYENWLLALWPMVLLWPVKPAGMACGIIWTGAVPEFPAAIPWMAAWLAPCMLWSNEAISIPAVVFCVGGGAGGATAATSWFCSWVIAPGDNVASVCSWVKSCDTSDRVSCWLFTGSVAGRLRFKK